MQGTDRTIALGCLTMSAAANYFCVSFYLLFRPGFLIDLFSLAIFSTMSLLHVYLYLFHNFQYFDSIDGCTIYFSLRLELIEACFVSLMGTKNENGT